MIGRLAGSLIVAVGLATAAVAPATSAGAASVPQCTTSRNVAALGGGPLIVMPATSSGNTNCWLAQGDVSYGVRALQLALRYCWGFTSVAVDRNYGPKTKAAVTEVQNEARANGTNISVDGIYGPQTKMAIAVFYLAAGGGCDVTP